MKLKNNMNVRSALFAVLIAATMTIAAPAVVLADMEPNNYMSEAEYTYDGAYESGTLDEMTDSSDYYYLYLNSGENLDLDLTGTGDDFDLTLYQSLYGSEVASSTNYGSDESISYLATSYNTYYIEVYAISGSGSYDLSIDVSQPVIGGGEYYVGGNDYVSGQPLATLPTLTVGDSAYFGGITDIGEEYKDKIDDLLNDPTYSTYLEDMDVSYDISGGVGAFMGWEVSSNSADVNGDTCYDIALTGGIGVDIGLEGSVDGDMSAEGYSASIDASADGYVTFEATLDGHLYLTVDEMAIAKLVLTVTAEGEAKGNLDASMSAEGYNMDVTADLTASIEGVEVNFELTFDPPLDVFQFGTGSGSTEGIYEGKQWYVPGEDTTASGSITAEGTITYDVHAEMPGEEPVDESETVDLADEIGNPTFSEVIPGGEYDYWDYSGGTLFECTYASGDIFVIETDMTSMLGDFTGTRQFDDVTGMMPTTGMQYDKSAGMITGMTIDGEAMTEEVSESDVTSFTEDPLGETTSETGGHSSSSDSLLAILLIAVVVVVVIIVVVVVVMRKKKTPPMQHPQPYQQQPMYQQPPPPPQQYPPQDQYQQNGQYQQPPPPPPQY